jgi:DNA excision repair protein ERCC-3
VKPEAPLVVQADHTVLVETYHPEFERMRARLGRFAELWKSPEHLHFYRITPVSIWNAAALGESCEDILAFLHDNARFPLAPRVGADIEAWHRAYGSLVFLPADGERVGDGDDAVSSCAVATQNSPRPCSSNEACGTSSQRVSGPTNSASRRATAGC